MTHTGRGDEIEDDLASLYTVNVCAGVTTQIPDPEMSSFTLLTMAEKALDQAREQGGDRAVFLPSPSPGVHPNTDYSSTDYSSAL